MPELLAPSDLRDHLQAQLPEAQALSAIRVATGHLKAATGLTVWPDPVPDALWAWALELAALVIDNPTGRQSDEAGDVVASWPARRRAEILAAAAQAYGRASGPRGTFPPSPLWPA